MTDTMLILLIWFCPALMKGLSTYGLDIRAFVYGVMRVFYLALAIAVAQWIARVIQ